MIKAVIFDKDGVIVDSEPLHARANRMALEYFGKEAPEEYFYNFVGSTVVRMVEQINLDFQLSVTTEEWREVAEHIKGDIVKTEGYIAVPHVMDLIRSLFKEGFILGVASNSPFNEIQNVLDHFGITGYFHVLVSGLSVPHPKPAPDIFLKAAQELGVTPKECLVFEDSYYGSLAASTAGMTCIGYTNPNSGNQDLSMADFCIESFESITPDFIKRYVS